MKYNLHLTFKAIKSYAHTQNIDIFRLGRTYQVRKVGHSENFNCTSLIKVLEKVKSLAKNK